jgi:hypothetical protein
MKPLTTTAFCIGIFMLSGCLQHTLKKNKVNEHHVFNDKSAYRNYLKNNTGFQNTKILYVDSKSYMPYVNDYLQKDSSMLLVGFFANDSTKLKRSEFLSENSSCEGRIIMEIKETIQNKQVPDSILERNMLFKQIGFKYLSDNRTFSIQECKAPLKLFVNYSTEMGLLYLDMYKKIIDLQYGDSRNVEVFVISMDPVDYYAD